MSSSVQVLASAEQLGLIIAGPDRGVVLVAFGLDSAQCKLLEDSGYSVVVETFYPCDFSDLVRNPLRFLLAIYCRIKLVRKYKSCREVYCNSFCSDWVLSFCLSRLKQGTLIRPMEKACEITDARCPSFRAAGELLVARILGIPLRKFLIDGEFFLGIDPAAFNRNLLRKIDFSNIRISSTAMFDNHFVICLLGHSYDSDCKSFGKAAVDCVLDLGFENEFAFKMHPGSAPADYFLGSSRSHKEISVFINQCIASAIPYEALAAMGGSVTVYTAGTSGIDRLTLLGCQVNLFLSKQGKVYDLLVSVSKRCAKNNLKIINV